MELRARHPALELVLVADRGQESLCQEIATNLGAASGWVRLPQEYPPNTDINDIHVGDPDSGAARAILEDIQRPAGHFRLLTAAEVAGLPAVRWRIRNIVPEEGLFTIYGAPGTGKSFLVMNMLGAIAEGREWFGRKVRRAPVVYLVLEGEGGMSQRIRAYIKQNGFPEDLRFVFSPIDIRRPEDRAKLVATLKAAGLAGGVLCIDTLAASAPGLDENAGAEMGEYIEALKSLQRELGGLILVVHHTGKDQSRGLRGHSSLIGALDFALELTRTGDTRRCKVTKSKDGSDGDVVAFRLKPVHLGVDDEGDAVTSCVVEQDEPEGETTRPATKPSGIHVCAGLDAVHDALQASTDFGKGSSPGTSPCIT